MAPRFKKRLDDLAKSTGMSKSQIVLNALHFQDEMR
jgi:predicted DNA-binding protein